MRDVALSVSGLLAILVAVAHAILGETKLFATASIQPASARRLLRAVWFCSAVAWAAGGVLILASPSLGENARRWIVPTFAVVFASAGIANAVATRGRHYGWVLLAGIVVIALCGL